ncbi:hypothetical protein ACIRL3_11005 [Streptomyces sp. NPDC102384]|uniref:hypothetical protein n=1 Tax=unclassified Streptomyces TaxID=2593676 RepID=UPI003804B770
MSLAGLQRLMAHSVRDAHFRDTVLAPGGLDTVAAELGLTEEEKRLFGEIEASYLHGIADFVLAQRIQRREAEFALFLNVGSWLSLLAAAASAGLGALVVATRKADLTSIDR